MKKSLLSFSSFMARVLPTSVQKEIYRIKPLARFVRSTLNRAVPTGLTEVTIAAGNAEGMKMRLDLQIEKDYWLGTYEKDLQETIQTHVKPGWTAYDIGANIGFVSLLFAQQLGESGQIFSFEALPTNLERLRDHIEINELESRVRVIPAAVTGISAPVRFLIGPSGAMGKVEGSAGRANGNRKSIEVPGICLDDFVYRDGNPPPQVIKMDIEGGEVLAMKGMKRLLAEFHPLILLELHGPESAQVAWEVLTKAKYRIYQMQHGNPSVPSLEALDWKAYLVAR
jgi:FkbM family methyltransferase